MTPAHTSAQSAVARAASKAASSPGPGPTPNTDPSNPPSPVAEPVYFENGLLLRTGETVQPLGPNLMGDLINESTGGLSFSQTDVSIPGNSALPVAVARRLATGTRQTTLGSGLFGDWDLEIPHLRTVALSGAANWYGGTYDGRAPNESRCSQLFPPPRAAQNIVYESWWDGYQLVTGSGSQTLLKRLGSSVQPTDGGAYPVVTKQHWQFSCLPTLARGSGEGFIGLAPDGTRYRFDHMVQRPYTAVTRYGRASISRQEIMILPTLITDRFGNWVRYTYGGADGLRVISITSSDGRAIYLTYNGIGNRIWTVSDATRTWTYNYDSSGALQTVTLPDNSQWRFVLADLERDPTFAPDLGCGSAIGYFWDNQPHSGTITHPSGAQGVFTVKMTQHGRTLVPGSEEGCEGAMTPGNVGNLVPRYYNNYALIKKELSGPGMPEMAWNYEYPESGGAFASEYPYAGTKTVYTSDPHNNRVQKIFGTGWGVNEGLLLTNVVISNANTPNETLQTTAYEYAAPSAGPHPGDSYSTTRSDIMSSVYTPQRKREITQQGVVMTQQVSSFDTFLRPRGTTNASTLGTSRSESTTYDDNLQLWVLGQAASRTIDGVMVSQTVYGPSNALPLYSYKFGKLQATYGFYSDGTLYRITDGLNHATTFGNYKRGLPQTITYADTTSISGVVDNIGVLTSVTNEAGTTWTYGYDAMGRLSSKTPPPDNGIVYNPTLLSFEQVFYLEHGLVSGHWRQTITTGSAVTVNYFDARWRKRLTTTYDANDRAGTERVQRFEYDAYNKTTFASYPARSADLAVKGTTSTYDALGRTTLVVADSELGPLTTTTRYLAGLKTEITNPRSFITTQEFQVFDSPSQDYLTRAVMPHGVSVAIERDTLGTPLSVTRSGGARSATRRYVYDAYRQLCKTVEPESGATVQVYDAAGNVTWRASGQSFPGPGCETTVADSLKINYSYDLRNRLKDTMYGDGSPAINRVYTPDGLLQQTSSNGFVWRYAYHNRRVLRLEEYAWPGVSIGNGWNFTWGITENGTVSGLTDPWGTMHYSPNALGEPTQISGYASNITYYPNGMVKDYTLANRITHHSDQSMRGLPTRVFETGPEGVVLHETHVYDENGNVTGITDHQISGASRSMGYDGLDRLTAANGVWGAGSFGYDGLDNLTTSVIGGRTLAHNVDATTNRLTSLSGSQNTGIGYDANGNVTERGTQFFQFDIGNRLTQAVGKASYQYDGHGRRAWTTFADGNARLDAYSNKDGLLRFTSRSVGGTTRNVYLGTKLIAEVGDAWVTNFRHTDALGSPVAKTNSSAVVVSSTKYEPYGATAAGTNPVGIGFTGHVNDPDTGLVYMQQRYYDPVAGRFLSVDPIAADSSNGAAFGRFYYANNNPFLYVDPDGRAASQGGGFGFGWEAACEPGECAKSLANTIVPGPGTPEMERAEKRLREIADAAQKKVDDKCDWKCMIPGVRGTLVHSEFTKALRQLGSDSEFSPEISYLNGVIVDYGTPGSSRADVVVGDLAKPLVVFDLKTGFAYMSRGQAKSYGANLPAGTPFRSLRPTNR